jgi:proteasome assembly chaperone (PAC2) family protein
MAFEGWNDAGEAASSAAQIIRTQRAGFRFASIDPEPFFVFTDTRPQVRLTRRGRRRIEWPSNDFYACLDPATGDRARDLVVLLGTEPDLRWQEFSSIVLSVAQRVGVSLVMLLGALSSDVPHTVPPYVSGTATNPQTHPLVAGRDLKSPRYEGPTGITGVLSTRFADAGYPVVDLWGHAPHYIQASPNPLVTSSVLREVSRILEIDFDLAMLDDAARRFDEQVREAVSKDPEAMAYVRELEVQYEQQRRESPEEDAVRGTGELPSGQAMIDALEDFLRKRRRPPGPGPTVP